MRKQWTAALCALFAAAALAGCSASDARDPAPAAPAQTMQKEETAVTEKNEALMIRITDEAGRTVRYTLNDSPAAASLYRQLPLTVKVENFSTNEKIFYPAALDLRDTPHPKMEVGTLAYYAPWGNVVMFFDAYRANSDLYELGFVADGMDQIARLSGTITVEAVQQ